jgi:CRP-like cAMP-binding protein
MMPALGLRKNGLLAALPDAELQRVLPQLEPVELLLGQSLYEPGCRMSHLYLPTTAIASLLYEMQDGGCSEIAIVGNEGIVGVNLVLGADSTPSRAVVLSAGTGLRMPAQVIEEEFCRSSALRDLLLRYTQALITQIAQTAVCNRHHRLEQQLCRVLLLSLDRRENDDLALTQEAIANLLGVRREGVTEAAQRLQVAGLIHYSRGHITVLDRAGLERRTCECYAVVKREYDRLLPAARGIASTQAMLGRVAEQSADVCGPADRRALRRAVPQVPVGLAHAKQGRAAPGRQARAACRSSPCSLAHGTQPAGRLWLDRELAIKLVQAAESTAALIPEAPQEGESNESGNHSVDRSDPDPDRRHPDLAAQP